MKASDHQVQLQLFTKILKEERTINLIKKLYDIKMLKLYFFFRWYDINIRDCLEMARFPGLYRMCLRNWLPGCKEIIKSIFYPLAIRDLRKFIPELSYKDVKRSILSASVLLHPYGESY